MPALYWLLDVYMPDFQLGYGNVELKGKVLITSNQLWSLMGENTVRSSLIGPGYIFGQGTLKGSPVTFESPIGALIMDPTELRPHAPVPLIDIITPEVIDPLETSSPETIKENIMKIVIRKGQVLGPVKVAEVHEMTNIPMTAFEEDVTRELHISHVSGIERAKFILAGKNRRLFDPFVRLIKRGKYQNPHNLRILRVDKKRIDEFMDADRLGEWVIIEKAQELTPEIRSNTLEEFRKEYELAYNDIRKNWAAYIYY
ncbi:MAG: hypothetical protein ACFFBS_08475 [Promethearchaeota archaeon]